ncbi:GNAT family N-acetyltransferase [Corynebacterium yudongzhengii]|uniref:N-acetyltransferase n=1 Tax=Corynebacterium yudongzhengii TaxID=2080740 RepID=A0A2U1T446_9CORY|nr:N-acetyltransferase [Corynebacterium yudongzhengii]AWB80998.1 GNAT family N-acetyltransferase [Corynebacterium yudongzhengii]PWC00780.1 N-acetyltransferase [Corynebacterium yudongzhengii]
MNDVTIRRETDADIPAITELVGCGVVEKLRDDNALAVSLVAVEEFEIVGHIAASPVRIDDGTGGWFSLGPVTVAEGHRGRGIGSRLIEHAIDALKEGGAGGAVLVGDPAYYGRFGFVRTEFLTHPGNVDDYLLRALRLGDSRFPAGDVHAHPALQDL